MRRLPLADGVVCVMQIFSAEFEAAIQRFSTRAKDFSVFRSRTGGSCTGRGGRAKNGKMGAPRAPSAIRRPLAAQLDKS